MSYPHEPQKEARWDKPPSTASPTPGTWEKQREATGGYRTRTGKPKNSHQVGAHAGLSRTTARSVRFLWSALNYGLSKLTSQDPHWDRTPHQGTLLQVESKLHDALDRLVCPQMQAKSQLQTFVLMTPPPHLLRWPSGSLLLWSHCYIDLSGHSSAAEHVSLFQTRCCHYPLASCIISIN